MRHISFSTLLMTAATFLLCPGTAVQAEQAQIEEWDVPWERTRPRDPDLAPDGSVWFCGQGGHYLGHLDPATGEITKRDLPEGTGPHNLIVDTDGQVWFAGNLKGYIGRMDPDSGEIERFPMPLEAAGDPHTLVFGDRGEFIWFTVQRGNFVGRLERSTGEVRLMEVPTPQARPYGIIVAPDGTPWFTEFGSNKLAYIDTEALEVVEVPLPREEARPRRLAATSDGRIWYGDYATGMLGVHDPEGGGFREWELPGGEGAMPYAVTVDPEDRIWTVETGPAPNRLVGFDTGSEDFVSITPIPSGAGAVRHMIYDPARDAIWFGADTNTVGIARLP